MRTVQNREAEVEHAVLGFVAAWNEDDPDRLWELLEKYWAEHGIVVSNYETIISRNSLYEHILRFRRDNPGTRCVLTSGVEQHHDFFRFAVVTVGPDGRRAGPALDVGELDSDGRIDRIISFMQELPHPPTHWPDHLTADFDARST